MSQLGPNDPGIPVRIGAGSFATVYSANGHQFAFKVVHRPERADELRAEFQALHSLYLTCNSDSLFAIPRAIAYLDPSTDLFVRFPAASPGGRARDRDDRPSIAENLFDALKDVLDARFRSAYLAACPEELRDRAREFITAVEAVQVTRDRASATEEGGAQVRAFTPDS